MNAPQIIYLALIFISLLIAAHKHGEERKPYNFWESFVGAAIAISIVSWGGFFN